jgi:hypothetical protein
MKTFLAILILCAVPAASLGQHRGMSFGGGARGGFGGGRGFGGGIHAGGRGFGGGLGGGFRGGFVSGGYRWGGYGGGFGVHRNPFGNVVFPGGSSLFGRRFNGGGFYGGGFFGGLYAPIYPFATYSGFYDPLPYAYPYEPGAAVTVIAPPAVPAPAPVVIYQPEPRLQRRSYVDDDRDDREYRQPIYLIAFKDQTIQAALAYWVEDRTLHYVTRGQEHQKVPLDQVDRAFSEQLNRDRRVEFHLP